MNFNCTLDSFKVPGMSGVDFPFGTKNPNDVPIFDDEAVMNAAMPFTRQRPFLANEDSATSRIDAHSLFALTASGISLTLGSGGFIGCEARVINVSDGSAEVTYGETKTLKPGAELKIEWDGAAWIERDGSGGVKTPDGFGQYQEGRNLLEVLDVQTPAEAVAVLHGRCNNGASAADGEADFSGLQIGDYIPGIDLSAIPAENGGTAGQAYNETYHNNDIVISGFNTFKQSGDTEVTKNHILFTFRNIPVRKRVNSSDTNSGGYPASELRAFLEGANGDGTGNKSGVTTAAFLNALKAQIGDYILTFRKLLSNKGSWAWVNCTLFPPSEHEVFGNCAWSETGYDDGVRVHFPIYQKSSLYRCKRYNGARDWWFESSPYAAAASSFCYVNSDGSANSVIASAVGGCAPAFCVA
jgi:hypothetical protein